MTNRKCSVVATLALCLGLLLAACAGDNEAEGEHAGGESSGEHGGSEDANTIAAREDGAEGGSAPASATYLTTSEISRGVFSGPEVQADDYYADKLNGLEFALSYDGASGSFLGRVKNEASEGLCDSRIKVILDGDKANSQSLVIPSLEVRERATFTLTADSGSFATWSVETETFTCNNTPVHGSFEGDEGGEGGSEGGEGGHEGSEGGEENEGLGLSIDQPAVANINGFDLNIVFDPTAKAFTGVMTNRTSQLICGGRLEIHVGRSGSTLELGPTVDVDWAPGQARTVVLGFDAMPGDTYSLHPEVTPCPGSSAAESAEGDEESGTRYAKDETHDESRRGARLVLRYDADQDAFVGTVTNTTDAVLDRVRVEVHLSNGVELGPTTPDDLQPGESAQITLPADGEQFDAWSAHPESGSDEHGTEGDAEHDESSN
ncbi:hypothetical protein [Candidatus Poriferisodalis sp.]|uniref:hypothetical protein n=1 Tax=Candidatus Poriferisodalis sp. TaxID=3101277 RepID=UPI003AF4BD85